MDRTDTKYLINFTAACARKQRDEYYSNKELPLEDIMQKIVNAANYGMAEANFARGEVSEGAAVFLRKKGYTVLMKDKHSNIQSTTVTW